MSQRVFYLVLLDKLRRGGKCLRLWFARRVWMYARSQDCHDHRYNHMLLLRKWAPKCITMLAHPIAWKIRYCVEACKDWTPGGWRLRRGNVVWRWHCLLPPIESGN